MTVLRDFRLAPLEGRAPKKLIILLHGLGDRGDGGLLELGTVWAPSLKSCAFHCPDAPESYDLAPPDFGGRQWFSLKQFSIAAMNQGVEEVSPLLNQYLDQCLNEYQLTNRDLGLVGFSQGAMLALYAGLRRPEAPAFILSYSGILLNTSSLKKDRKDYPPVFLAHGELDNVVPFSCLREASRELMNLGISYESCSAPYGHTIENVGVSKGISFIKSKWVG